MDITSILKIKELFGLKEWYEDIRYGKHNDLRQLARRVLKVLKVHNIPASRIPWVFPEHNFKQKNFATIKSVIDDVIDENFLNTLTNKFHLNRSWLDTGYGAPQKVYEYGYEFDRIYDLLTNLSTQENQWSTMYFIAEKGTKFVPAEDHSTFQGVIIVLATTIESNDTNFSYTHYLPVYIGRWHDTKTRMMIKAISLLCFQLSIHQKGYFSKKANYRAMDKYFVAEVLDVIANEEWYPDDYIFSSVKSQCSKDREDAERMHDYLRKKGYFDRIKNLRPCEWLD